MESKHCLVQEGLHGTGEHLTTLGPVCTHPKWNDGDREGASGGEGVSVKEPKLGPLKLQSGLTHSGVDPWAIEGKSIVKSELAINTTGECFLLYFSPFDAEGITGWLDLGKTSCFWFVKSYYSSSIIKKTKWW